MGSEYSKITTCKIELKLQVGQQTTLSHESAIAVTPCVYFSSTSSYKYGSVL